MSSLTERLLKNSTIKETSTLDKSKIFQDNFVAQTGVPIIDLALSGEINGGLSHGLGLIAGPSKHFKSSLSLLMVRAYLNKFPEAVCLFYDSEFGTKESYFESFEIDTDRVVHTPITNVEELKFDIVKQLEEIKKGDRVIILVDSVGNLASKKEVEDALNEKSVADMTRAKALKSLYRIVTPHLTLKDIPMIAINHTYDTIEMFSKAVISGGTGQIYSADWAFIIGRSQRKEGTDLAGYNFTINIEKSRFVKEKSKLPFTVYFDGGILKWSGMLELALESGHVTKPKMGWYTRPSVEGDKSWREKETMSNEFWAPLLLKTDFPRWLKDKFQLQGDRKMLNDEAPKTEESEVLDSETE